MYNPNTTRRRMYYKIKLLQPRFFSRTQWNTYSEYESERFYNIWARFLVVISKTKNDKKKIYQPSSTVTYDSLNLAKGIGLHEKYLICH